MCHLSYIRQMITNDQSKRYVQCTMCICSIILFLRRLYYLRCISTRESNIPDECPHKMLLQLQQSRSSRRSMKQHGSLRSGELQKTPSSPGATAASSTGSKHNVSRAEIKRQALTILSTFNEGGDPTQHKPVMSILSHAIFSLPVMLKSVDVEILPVICKLICNLVCN